VPRAGVSPRTFAHARDSDATLWLGETTDAGDLTTRHACRELGRPFFVVTEGQVRPSVVAAWVGAGPVRVLNVAEDPESTSPGIGDRVERFLGGGVPATGRGPIGGPQSRRPGGAIDSDSSTTEFPNIGDRTIGNGAIDDLDSFR